MDSISPLAKILAEANGIDWRSIRGSGEGGSVVEQDILNYLSRVMSGDEEPPATPVDEAPPGWTGEMPPMPAAVAASGLQALSAAGVESDITDFVAQQSQSGQMQGGQVPASAPTEPVTSVPEPVAPETVIFRPSEPPAPAAPAEHAIPEDPEDGAEAADNDLEFELDDEPGEESTGEALSVPPVAAMPELPEVQPAAAVSPEVYERPAYDPAPLDTEAEFVLADAFPGAGTGAESLQLDATPTLASPEAVSVSPAASSSGDAALSASPVQEPAVQGVATEVAATAGGFGLGGFLSRLYGAKTEAAPAEPTLQSEPTIGSAHSETVLPPVQVAGASATPLDSGETNPEAVLGEPLISQAPPIPDTPVAAPLVADQWRDQEAVADQAVPEPQATPDQAHLDAPPMIDHALTGPDESVAEGHEMEAPEQAPDLGHLELGLGQPIALPEAHEGGLEAEAPIEQFGSEQAPSGFPQAAGLALGAAGTAAGLMAHGDHEPAQSEAPEQTDAPAAEVAEPQAPVSSASSTPASAQAITLRLNVDLGVLETARAQLSEALFREVPISLLVARAAARSLSTLSLSAPGGVALADHAGQPLATDLSGDFRASLGSLGEAAHSAPALLVLDASGLGLDELHRGECSLSVGRSSGEGAALSLRGDLDPARGAQFLHEVAGLLNTPIRLLF